MYSLELLMMDGNTVRNMCSVNPNKISLIQADSSICLTYACCSMYSLELLMMDGNTVRNMCSVNPK